MKASKLAMPVAVQEFFRRRWEEREGARKHPQRLTPLMLLHPMQQVFVRRSCLFSRLKWSKTPSGFDVQFARTVKPSKQCPSGREIRGCFETASISDSLCIVISQLEHDADKRGPRYLARKSYPLARRPFITSTSLRRIIDGVADLHAWHATCIDAMGYTTETRKFRRDMKRQPIGDAIAEMNDQGRQVHRAVVSFRDESHVERLRVSFDRYASAVVYRGRPEVALTHLVLPAVELVESEQSNYQVGLQAQPREQDIVEIVFPDEALAEHRDMRALCDATRRQEGLSVTIVHLNPYLQAQVLDFMTGAAVEMLVMDGRTVSLIPRSRNCHQTLQQITATIFRYFGEAEVHRRPIDTD